MKKSAALALLGGTPTTAAFHLECTRQAVHDWPDELPRRIEDRVLAARLRLECRIAHEAEQQLGLKRKRKPLRVSVLLVDAVAI